jgi:hypothetical protein
VTIGALYLAARSAGANLGPRSPAWMMLEGQPRRTTCVLHNTLVAYRRNRTLPIAQASNVQRAPAMALGRGDATAQLGSTVYYE